MADDEDDNNAQTISFRIKPTNLKKIDEYAQKSGTKNRSNIINEAIIEYIERKENPDLFISQIRETLRKHPELLDEPLRRIAAGELTKK